MTGPRRLDQLLVAQGLARSRTQAQALVREGLVLVEGRACTRASQPVDPGTPVTVTAPPGPEGESAWISRGWVGRGALKLDHALTRWGMRGLDVSGARCLDVGASTGGFTQVLLEHGAAEVVALDVGRDQLDPRVGTDPRVVDLPGTHVRQLTVELVGGPRDVVVCDVSFISLTHALGPMAAVCAPAAHLVVLAKPQFEVGRQALPADGVVRSARAREEALIRVHAAALRAGLELVDADRSPIRGGGGPDRRAGNVEYLLWLRPRQGIMDPPPERAAELFARLTHEEDR